MILSTTPRAAHRLASTCASLLAIAGALFFACSDTPPTRQDGTGHTLTANELPVGGLDPTDALNEEFRSVVLMFSAGQGLDFFKLPESTDYNAIPQDPLNPITAAKVSLGRLLFHEAELGGNNVRPEGAQTYVCATCHPVQSSFFSALPQAIGEGGSGFGATGEGRVLDPAYDSAPDEPDVQPLRSPTTVNIAFQQLAMRDGRLGGVGLNTGTDPLWNEADGTDANSLGHHGPETQAFAGLKDHRMGDVDSTGVAGDSTYQALFAAAFPGDPVVNRYNAAMALAAYERTILSNQAPFQLWLRGQKYTMTDAELRGGILFFTRASCNTCHTGKSLSATSFFAIGMHDLDNSADPARVDLTRFGGTVPDRWRKGRGGFTGNAIEEFAFKVPTLYNVRDARFYGHGASFTTIRDVVQYYNQGVKENPHVPLAKITPLFRPLNLSPQEVDDLTAFVSNALYDPNLARYAPSSTPSGQCFPANDPQARTDLGCSAPSAPGAERFALPNHVSR